MSYRFEEEPKSIVIDGFEKGIAASPYQGIANIQNLNTTYYPGVVYTNYKRLSATLTTGAETVTLDNFNSGSIATGSATVSYVHNCSGSNRVLNVYTQVNTGDTILSVTAGGVSMSPIGTAVTGADSTQVLATYGLVAPALGNVTVTVTRNNSSGTMGVSGASFIGCKQSGLPDSVTQTTGTNSVTTTMSTSADNCYVFSYAGSADINAGSGETLLGKMVARTVTTTYNSTTTFTAPAGVTSVTAEVWGAGGGGGHGNTSSANGGGGGGGAYAKKVVTVTPGNSYTVTVGTGGTNAPSGGNDSWFSTSGTVIAKGGGAGGDASAGVNGTSGAGGSAGSSIGDVVYGGGAGAGGGTVSTTGGGGGGAGSTGAGGAATTTSGGTGTTVGGGNGGAKGSPGNPGLTNGGGGAGGDGSGSVGGAGARGQVVVTYTIQNFGVFTYSSNPKTPAGSVSMTSTTTGSGSTVAQIMVAIAPKVGSAMTNPVQKATSPQGINYILDDSGQIWKQSAANSSTFNYLASGTGRYGTGASGIAWWDNYLVVFGQNLVEFCGDGTGDAGIISTNWNRNGSGIFGANTATFSTNYAGSPITLTLVTPTATSALPKFTVGDPVTFTTTGTLPGGLSLATTYYIAKINNATLYVSTSAQNAKTYLSAAVTAGATTATLAVNWTGTTGSYQMLFSDSELKTVTLTNGSTAVSWSGGLSGNVTILTSVLVTLTSDGTGTHTITDNSRVLPLGNYTINSFGFTGSYPYTTGTWDQKNGSFGSYTDPTGQTVTGVWQGPTGLYNIVQDNGQVIPTTFTNGSADFQFLSAVYNISTNTGWTIRFLSPNVTNYRPYTSKVDGSLYFCNGQYLGRLASSTNQTITFNPTVASTYSVSNGVASIPEQYTDTIVDMVDLKNNLIIAGQYDVYVWDYLSPQTSSPTPVGELITGITNLLSNIYILAGKKGNIYVSNGYSAQLFYKMPDYIAGVIDPIWNWGALMVHRSRLFFQSLVQNSAGTNVLAGIFSLIVSPSMLGEQASGLVMEAQNSYGLTPSAGASANGALIDNQQWSSGTDSYYSVWSSGTSTGGIDYNSNTLWGNYEPTIETDIIPVGTILNKQTFGNIEFKLDRPMASGDLIKIYWRPSLTDSYTLMGTTSTTQLSEYYPSNFAQAQWAQFKVQFKCASSNSSFIPLREIRLNFN